MVLGMYVLIVPLLAMKSLPVAGPRRVLQTCRELRLEDRVLTLQMGYLTRCPCVQVLHLLQLL